MAFRVTFYSILDLDAQATLIYAIFHAVTSPVVYEEAIDCSKIVAEVMGTSSSWTNCLWLRSNWEQAYREFMIPSLVPNL